MWLFEEIVPGTTLYIITRGVELRGALDRARLERSVHAVCARQEALRTKLVLDDGRPYQVIVEKVSWEHRVVDHADLDEDAREEAFEKLELAWIQQPFDFTRAPPWRTTLIREAEDVHVLLLSGHHVLFDARSMRRWFVEVLEHYTAFEEGRSPTVPELPFHAVDVAAWHLRRFNEGALEKERAYWQKQLEGAPTGLRLGAFGAERAKGGAGHDGARRVLRLPEEQVQSLRRIGQAHGATSLATYAALFAVVLGRVTGEDEFIIGTPVDLRDRPELVPLIGMLVHALALRFDLAGEPTFSELLVRARDVARAALTNSAVSMGDIVQDLSLGRSVYRQPLFEVMFDLTRQEPVPSSPTLAATPITEGTEPVPRDLVLRVRESAGDEVEIVMEWRVRMIPKELAAVLWKGFLNLARQVAEDPNRAISEYVLG
jgi:Condensation domain